MNNHKEKVQELFTLFDHVYVINRPDDIQRREGIKKALDGICDSYEIFNATDGWKDNVPMVMTSENKLYDGWTKGAAGLVDTTIRLIQDAKAKGYGKILIMEDDLVFNYMLGRAADDFQTCPPDWELFHFTSKDYKRPRRHGRVKKLGGAWSCQMYAIKSEIYDEYLLELSKRDKPIDLITSGHFHPRGKSYAVRYNVVNTLPNMSAIRNRFVHYH